MVWGVGASPLSRDGLKAIRANVQAETARPPPSRAVSYTQAVQGAFRETRDALGRQPHDARRAGGAQSQRAQELQRALDLADLRYRAGYSGYIDVLDAQRQLLQAQTSLQIVAARDVRFALVDLAKALGGGWEYRDAVAAR